MAATIRDLGPIDPTMLPAFGSGAASSGGSKMGFDPVSLALGGIGGLFNFFSVKNQIKAQKEQQERQIAADAARQNQQIGYGESQLDPFRQLMAQGRDLSQLDMRQNTTPPPMYSPLQAGQTQRETPIQTSRYTPSPELLDWLSMIKQNIAGGQNQAPTMTNPANYGKTSALDLLALSKNPSAAGYARGASFAPSTPTMRMVSPGRRRDEMV